MSPVSLYRLSGVALIIGGLLFAVGNLMHPIDHSEASHAVSTWTAAHATFMVGTVGMLLGLPALYARQAERAGWLGLVAFVTFFIGLANILGSSWFEAFAVPVLDEAAIHEVEHGPGVAFGAVGGILFLGGQVLYGITTYRARREARLASAALVLSAAVLIPTLGMTGTFAGVMIIGSTAVLGAAIAWLGWTMLPPHAAAASTEDAAPQSATSVA